MKLEVQREFLCNYIQPVLLEETKGEKPVGILF